MKARPLEPKRAFFAVLRGISIFAISYLVSTLTTLRIRALYIQESSADFQDFPREGVAAIAVITSLLIFNSVCRFFFLYYRLRRVEYLEKHAKTPPTLRFALRETDTYLEGIGILLIPLLLIGAHPFLEAEHLVGLAQRGDLLSSAAVTLPMLVIYLAIYLWQSYECRRYFHFLHSTGELSRLEHPVRIVSTALIILVGYPSIIPYAPYLLFSLYSLARIFFSLLGVLTIPIIATLVILALFLPPLIRYVRARRSRRRLLARIRALCAAHHYVFIDHTEENRRLGHIDAPHFTITRDGNTFACSFLFRQYPRLPLYFSREGEGYSLCRLGIQGHHLDIRLPFTYPTVRGVTNVLLCDPPPTHMFVTDGKRTQPVDFPDRIFNVILYSPATLIGAIEREHLGRFASFSS